MKKLFGLSTMSGIGLVVFCMLLTMKAQTSTPGPDANTDILKMIHAGLPEAVVVSKIHEGSGHWDTSVDALIALKNAGATDGEVTALSTAHPALKAGSSAEMSTGVPDTLSLSETMKFIQEEINRQPLLIYTETDTMSDGSVERHSHSLTFKGVLADPATCSIAWTEDDQLKNVRWQSTWAVDMKHTRKVYVEPEPTEPDRSRGEVSEAYDTLPYQVSILTDGKVVARHDVKSPVNGLPPESHDSTLKNAWLRFGSEAKAAAVAEFITHAADLCAGTKLANNTEPLANKQPPAELVIVKPSGQAHGTLAGYYTSFVPDPLRYGVANVKVQKNFYENEKKQGHFQSVAEVAFTLGLCFLDGKQEGKYNVESIKPDQVQALEWFRKAVEDDKKAPSQSGAIDFDSGYVGYRFLGQGSPGITPNAEQAEFWLLAGAEHLKDANAAYNLGVAYLRGDVLVQNNEQAMHWLIEAAKMHNAHATILLGQLYLDGGIVPQDRQLAQQFFDSAPQLAAAEEADYESALAVKQQSDADARQREIDNRAAMNNILAQGLSNLANTLAAPTPIATATAQGMAKVNAAVAQNRQLQPQKTLEEAHLSLNAALAKAQAEPVIKANPKAGGEQAISSNTGTAPPPTLVCPDVTKPCIPMGQYQQMQAKQQASGQGICPASGFVPGVMIHPTSDVAVGVPCKPGTPYGPLIATTASGGYTGVTPPDPAQSGGSSGSDGTSGSTSSGGSGGCVNLHQFVAVHSQFLTGLGHCVGEVSVHITNNSNVTVDCSIRFHKNGSWDLHEPSGIVIPPGQTLGGESDGGWTCGADTSDIEDACFARDSTDNQGRACSYDVKW